DRRAALAANPVAAQVQRDPIEPRRKLRLPLEAGEGAECTEERLLADVARILLAADDAVRQGVNRAFPSEDELVEAFGITAHRSGDELVVGKRHFRSRGPSGPVSG